MILQVLEKLFSPLFRCVVSLVLHHDEECTTSSKIESLKQVFQKGSILESLEARVDFPTFHIEWKDEEKEIRNIEAFNENNKFPNVTHMIFKLRFKRLIIKKLAI